MLTAIQMREDTTEEAKMTEEEANTVQPFSNVQLFYVLSMLNFKNQYSCC